MSTESARPASPRSVKTTCPYCGVGCGVIAKADGNGGASIEGDPEHPANFGKLCSKGLSLGETLGLDTRLLNPMMRGHDGRFDAVEWETALDAAAQGFRRIADEHGPDSIAFYLSGQLLTEDYYVANKLMKGFFGSANVDTNSRLCMASSVAGHRRAFGADVVPGCYDDLDEADLIVLVGSNAAWCHPILFQRMMRNRRERGARIVVVDPRKTPSAEDADLFLGIAPGMDVALFSGLLAFLESRGVLDRDFIAHHTDGFADALARARDIAPSREAIARVTGLRAEDVERFFHWFAETERTVTCYSQGVNQSAQGTDKVNAIINCHLATGRIGRPGMGPFSLTGQPNAMGGREVGGLANQLAAHMAFTPEDRDRVARFWNAPNLAGREGLKAVQMFEAIETGRVKALWVMGTNPVASLPRGDAMANALAGLDLFVVSDNVLSNDTIKAGPHILLPAAAWGEKDGTVTNSERRISRQRPFLPLPGKAKPDWQILSEVAARLGWGHAFSYDGPAQIFAEHAALSTFENGGARAFDLSALATDRAAYDAFDPFQWPVTVSRESKRLFADGVFFTKNGKARFVAVASPAPAEALSERFPLRLNTGRLRDQWHTMTRTGLSPKLAAHSPEPVVQVHPEDAQRFGLEEGGFARIATAHGTLVARVSCTESQSPGCVFMPMHWNLEFAALSRVSALVGPACDPHSGQPELKATPCALEPVHFSIAGYLVSRRPVALGSDLYTARSAVTGGYFTRFAADMDLDRLQACVVAALPTDTNIAEYGDEERGLRRFVASLEGRIDFCFFAARRKEDLPEPNAALAALAQEQTTSVDLIKVLSGSTQTAADDPAICVCFGVRRSALLMAIDEGCLDVSSLGRATKAGTNCGSCRSDLARVLREAGSRSKPEGARFELEA